MAMAPGHRELPQPRLNELQVLQERFEKLFEESMGRPIPAGSESPPEPSPSSDA